jgi:hypothetical protein
MNAVNIVARYTISEDIEALLTDITSHYFGGYYHVRIQVVADVPVLSSAFANVTEYEDAVSRLGKSVQFSRILEKMAVPENQIEQVRTELTGSFDANVLPYLMREGFADSFVRSKYCKALAARTPRFR